MYKLDYTVHYTDARIYKKIVEKKTKYEKSDLIRFCSRVFYYNILLLLLY